MYATNFPIFTLDQSLEMKTNKNIDNAKNNIGIIENEEDEEIVPFNPSME
jgi:hypothetical protein